MREIMKTLSNINNIWGVLAIIVFLVVGWDSLADNVSANGIKSNIAIEILQQQTVIMASIVQSLDNKNRDHADFKEKQNKAEGRDIEILRLMDKISSTLDRVEDRQKR